MPDLKVDPEGIRSGASQYKSLGAEGRNQASSIQEPDPMMMGLIFAPFLSFALPLLTQGLKESIQGVGDGFDSFGARLEDSAKKYDDYEQAAAKLAGKINEALS